MSQLKIRAQKKAGDKTASKAAAYPQSPLPGFDANQFAAQAACEAGFSSQPFSGKVSGAVAGNTAGKTVATILGEISSLLNKIWLLSQSVKHKAYLIGDLE